VLLLRAASVAPQTAGMRNTAVLSVAILLAACATQSSNPWHSGREVALATDFDLAAGDKVGVAGTRLVVEFDRVVEDSRCPMNARCVWEGNAKVVVGVKEFAANATERIRSISTPLELNTSERFAKRQSFGRFEVVLVHLEPTPMAGQKVDEYVATLRVEWSP
jgi:hypothetical protein